jgi:hypothetical protein
MNIGKNESKLRVHGSTETVLKSHDGVLFLLDGNEYFLDTVKLDEQKRSPLQINLTDQSKGSPLPIVSTLASQFLYILNKDDILFGPKTDEFAQIEKEILKNTKENLDLNTSFHLDETRFYPDEIKSLSYKKNTIITTKLTLIEEITYLIQSINGFTKGERASNSRLSILSNSFRLVHKVKYGEMIPLDVLYSKRIENINLKPLYVSKEKNASRTPHTVLAAKQHQSSRNLLLLAWAEFFFTQISKIHVRICTFCGQAYHLDGKGSHIKSTCGKDRCRKMLRKQRDEEKNKHEVRKKGNERQIKYRARKAIMSGTNTVEEYAQKINRPSWEVQQWINEYKIKQQQKGKI